MQEATDVSFNPGIEIALLETPVSNVNAVRIEFDFAINPGTKQIDAIGISDSEIAIEAKINTTKEYENIEKPETLEIGAIEAYSPITSQDGKKLYFSSNGLSDIDSENLVAKIYSLSKNASGSWDKPVLENESLNANPSYNYLGALYQGFMVRGGKPILIGTQECGYDMIENSVNHTLIESIKIVGYTNYDESVDLTITADKKNILIALESDFSQGGTDIYLSSRKPNGTYNLLQNAGKTINSAADETSLQLLSNQKTLLFASDGFSGFGNLDLYVTQRLDDTWKNWSEPINLGSKINSARFEGSQFYDEKNQILYFTTFEDHKKIIKKVKIPLSVLTSDN